MTMDDEMVGRYEDRELERLLTAYADARLRPAPAAMARIRARLMDAAAAQAPTTPRARATIPTPAAERFRPARPIELPARAAGRRRRLPIRRLGLTLAAAALALVALAGGALAAQAGGPLYGARVWLETLTLPADPANRVDAELQRLGQRLAEARSAAAHGNGAAVQAALDAYDATVNEALDTAGNDADLATRLDTALRRHLAVLGALRGTVPAAAADTLDRVLQRAQETVDRIEADHPGQGGGRGGDGGGAPSGSPGASHTPPGSPDKSTGPGKSTGPDKSTGPGKSTGPDKSQGQPGQSPSPDASPTDRPHGNPNPSPDDRPAQSV